MMTSRNFLARGVVAAVLSLSALGAMAASSTIVLGAKLSGASEVPGNTSTGTGTLEATLDTQSNVLNWSVTYSGLTGPVKAGHFHGPAAAGANAGVAVGFTGSVESPIKGSASLSAAQAADLLAGKWYVNLHTATHPSGELRGQVTPAP